MFMDDDRIAVYLSCTVVLIICSITLIRVYRFETALLSKVEEFSKHVRSITSERDFVPPPPAMSYDATQARVAPSYNL